MPLTLVNDEERGTLYVVATPIGNLSDITLRALDTLRTVHLIAAEDTRHTRKLLTYYDIHRPLTSYHAHNAAERGPELVRRMQAGENIALVTDAGTPGISDPGSLLVAQAVEAEIPVVVVPGPAALIAALVSSGLPTHPFVFLGFPPLKGRTRFFASYAALSMTLILYESPQRLGKTLQEMLSSWGDRRIAVARELTKRFEEIFRGRISEAIERYGDGTLGELVLVVEGAGEDDAGVNAEKGDWRQALATLLTDPAVTVRDASDQIADRFGQARRAVYREALKIREG